MATLKILHSRQVPQVDPEFQALIPPLKPEERHQLEANIVAEGCRDALVVWNGVLLDGHNRLEICSRLKIPFRTLEIALPDREMAKLWILQTQVGRRNLSPDQRAAIGFLILQRRAEISRRERARKGGLAGGSGRAKSSEVNVAPKLVELTSKPRLRVVAATESGVSERRIREVSEIARNDPAKVDQIAAGVLSIKDAKDQMREEARNKRLRAALKSNPQGGKIYTGDLSMLYRLLRDNSVDLFFTDPPYNSHGVPLFGHLARLAQAKLKPGGLCLVYTGQLYLPQVISQMSEHLDYYWLFGLRHTGPRTRVWARRVSNGFKPVLVFTKRPAPKKPGHDWVADFVAGAADKVHHEWGQGAGEAEYWIERLTLPGALVCDPCCGGGAILVACKSTGRRWIATEIDPGVAAAARARVAAFRKATRTGENGN